MSVLNQAVNRNIDPDLPAPEETPRALVDVTRHHVGKLAVRVHAA